MDEPSSQFAAHLGDFPWVPACARITRVAYTMTTSTTMKGDSEFGSRVARYLWSLLHYYFLFRSFAKACVDRAFHAMGLAFLEPRRGLMFAARKSQASVARLIGIQDPGWRWDWIAGERPPPPRCIAAVVNDQDDAMHPRCLTQLANLAVWCTEEGIGHVSMYDQDGSVRAGKERLVEAVVRATVEGHRRNRFHRMRACTYEVRTVDDDGTVRVAARFTCGGAATNKWAELFGMGKPSEKHSPGDSPRSAPMTTTVDLLRGGDGRAALLEAARRWRDEKQDRDGKQDRNGVAPSGSDDSITPRELEAWMERTGRLLPAVDLAIVFGKHFHASAYPPWQLHRAEIYHVDRGLWGFTRKGLRRVLRRYLSLIHI